MSMDNEIRPTGSPSTTGGQNIDGINSLNHSPFASQPTNTAPGSMPNAATPSTDNLSTPIAAPQQSTPQFTSQPGSATSNAFTKLAGTPGALNSTMPTGTTGTPTTATPMSTVMAGAAPAKKSPLKLILAIAIPVVVLLGGFLIWYFAFFNNNYVVIRDALNDLMANRDDSINLDINAESDGSKVQIGGTFNTLSSGKYSGDLSLKASGNGQSMNFGKLSFATNSTDFYIKLEPSDTLKQLGVDLTSISNQWIKFTQDDAKQNGLTSLVNPTAASSHLLSANAMTTSGSTATTSTTSDSIDPQCMQSGVSELDNKASRSQIISALIDTHFLAVDRSGSDKDGRIYQVKLDSSHYGDFIKKFVTTNYWQTISKCMDTKGSSLDEQQKAMTSDDAIKEVAEQLDKTDLGIKLWTRGAFDHRLAKVEYNLSSNDNGTKTSATITMKLSRKAPKVDMPSGAKSFDQLTKENPQLMTSIASLFMYGLNSGTDSSTGSLTTGLDSGANSTSSTTDTSNLLNSSTSDTSSSATNSSWTNSY